MIRREPPGSLEKRNMDSLRLHVETLPDSWKWDSLFTPLEGFEREWRSWLGQAQLAEERSLLAFWARRSDTPADRGQEHPAAG